MAEQSLPEWVDWVTFPFEGELRLKALAEPLAVEPPRSGEGDRECYSCARSDDSYIWVDDHWRVRGDVPNGLPTQVFLEPRAHLDQHELDDELAGDYGRLVVRLDRAIQAIGGIGRVHVSRWGDGGSHFHVWFMARPYGRRQMMGTFLPLWADIYPTTPDDVWNANLKIVAAELAKGGGRAVLA